jgi:segregation and condensation protein A
MMLFLKRALSEVPASRSIPLVPLFERQRSRRAMICLFLAVLEMVKLQAIRLTQKESFGEIEIRRDRGFDALEITPDAVLRIEEEYNA